MSQLTRRQVLKTAGLTAGAFAFPRRALAQTKSGTLITAQTTEATGLDPQLVPALSRSRGISRPSGNRMGLAMNHATPGRMASA